MEQAAPKGRPDKVWRKRWDSQQAETVPMQHITDFFIKVQPDEVFLSVGHTHGPYLSPDSPQEDIDEIAASDTWPIRCTARFAMSPSSAISLRDVLVQMLGTE